MRSKAESKSSKLAALRAKLLLMAPTRAAVGSPAFDELREIIERHPRAAEKLAGVERIDVTRREVAGNVYPELWLRTADGETRDCSWRACVLGASSDDLDVRRAMRFAVRDQIAAARDEAPPYATCYLCGNGLGDSISDTHVDHVEPFEDMATTFISWYGLPTSLVQLPQGGVDIPDGEWREHWRSYHYFLAELKVVHASCNLRRGRKAAP